MHVHSDVDHSCFAGWVPHHLCHPAPWNPPWGEMVESWTSAFYLGTLARFECFDRVLVLRWETLPSYSELDLTTGAPLACSCPRHLSGFWERALRYALTHRRAQVRRACPYTWITEFLLRLTATVSSNIFRKCHRLDTTLHRWRLPLHSFGECGARPAGGVQFKVSVHSRTPSERALINPSMMQRVYSIF